VNTDAPWPSLSQARARVLGIQAKLHRWSTGDTTARFDDLFNLVVDPAFLVMAWERVAGNRGARTAGVDRVTARAITAEGPAAVTAFLTDLREQVKSGTFAPAPVRQRLIPKSPGKYRRLGIPTVTDRVVQACLMLVLEPIFEADFHPSSYGFRPRRRAGDAVAEVQMFASRSYEWVFEGDITACFDEIDHTALMGRVRRRIGDKRVLALIKAFLKAGILSEDQVHRESNTGTPQGGILSPLLANIALEVLDEHFAQVWAAISPTRVDRSRRRRHGLPVYRLVRYADDFVVLVSGTREHAEALRDQVGDVLAPMGLRLSPEKTTVVHIDDGFDFLGFRIQRHRKPGTAPRRGRARPVPAPGAAGHPRPPRDEGRPAVCRAADPAHRRRAADRQAGRSTPHVVRGRGACRGRGDLGDLPADDRRLPPRRPPPRPRAHGQPDCLDQQRCPQGAGRTHQARQDAEEARRRRARLLRPAPHLQRAHRGDL
jgi:RNA-directed DNA polymerase